MPSELRKYKFLYPFKAFYKVPYLLPPWGEKEVQLLQGSLINNKEVYTAGFAEEIKKKLEANSDILFLNSGRSALKVLLSGLTLPAKSEIIVPVLCCRIIPELIKECGLIPAFADIGDDLCLTVNSIKGALSADTKAVMLVHAGGAAAREYGEIIEFCRTRGLYLIDNAAQGWGNEIGGSWLGGRGDAGIISFGLGKSTFGLGGGMLISRRCIIKKNIKRKEYSRAALLKFYLQYLNRNLTAPIFMFLDRCSKYNLGSDEIKQISYLDIALQYSIFRNLNALINRRTEVSLSLKSILDSPPISFPQGKNRHVWTKLIVRMPEKLKISLQRYLYLRRIETEDYNYPHYLNSYWNGNANFSDAGYPSAEKLYKELLVLPNSPRLSCSQLNYLEGNLKRFKILYL